MGANLVDIGALTNFWYSFNAREKVYDILEKLCGARLTSSYTRIGGLTRDAYPAFGDEVRAVLKDIQKSVSDITDPGGEEPHLPGPRQGRLRDFQGKGHFLRLDRAHACGPAGWTTTCARPSPTTITRISSSRCRWGRTGDIYDRIFVRLYEIEESSRIIEQALKKLPEGPVMTDDKRVALPPRQQTYGNIEGLMNHFKIIMHGICPEPGEIYDCHRGRQRGAGLLRSFPTGARTPTG